jgi:hypothetical protein
MNNNYFFIVNNDATKVWAEGDRDSLKVFRAKSSAETELDSTKEPLFEISKDELRRLLAWGDPGWVTVSFSGQLAHDLQSSAQEVGMLPENFTIEAVNAFIQAGRMAGH